MSCGGQCYCHEGACTYPIRRRKLRLQTVCKASKGEGLPPRPNKRFARKDVMRIKEDGPRIDDITETWNLDMEFDDGSARYKDTYTFVPKDVVNAAGHLDAPEPNWGSMPEMSYSALMKGLRERNWTKPEHFKPDSEPWKLRFYNDSGRTIELGWSGYRCVVTKADGQQSWVNIPDSGLETYTEDHLTGSSFGVNWKAKKMPDEPYHLHDYGYNQIFEEVFQAYEERLSPREALRHWEDNYVRLNPATYDCPGEHLLDVSYEQTPYQPSLQEGTASLVYWAQIVGLFSFLGVAVMYGIFRKRREMPSDPVQAMEFAQSKGTARKDGRTGVRFSDVAGLGEVIPRVEQVVEFLKNPKKYQALGGKPPKGILLEGDPGTGKTLLAKAIAGEAGVPFYQMSGSEFVETIVGVGAARVRDLFKRARVQEEACIIFVDEIDALGTKRAAAGQTADEEREQTLNQLLSELDGFSTEQGVVFMAATNRVSLLDPALLRAGRFDTRITVLRPDAEGREAILKVHARKRPVLPDVDFTQLARDLPGLSGAELANIMNEGALVAFSRGKAVIDQEDIYHGIERTLQGVRRPGLSPDVPMRRRFTIEEAGKAMATTLLRQAAAAEGREPNVEAVGQVSIVPRGRTWTRTTSVRGPDESYLLFTRAQLLERLQVSLAGRAAEEVLLAPEEVSTYASADLAEATDLAQQLLTVFGMNRNGLTLHAPIDVRSLPGTPQVHGAAHRSVSHEYQPAGQTVERTWRATSALLVSNASSVKALLERHKAALEQVVDVLQREETISGGQIVEILQSGSTSLVQ